jgi:Flp pilus assembly pilin Flp
MADSREGDSLMRLLFRSLKNDDGSAIFEYLLLTMLLVIMFFSGYQMFQKYLSPVFSGVMATFSDQAFTESGRDASGNPTRAQTRTINETQINIPVSIGTSGITFLICLLVFVLIFKNRLNVRAEAKEAKKQKLLGETGAAMVEFALVLPVFLLLFFGIFQAMLIVTAKQLVDYAAYAAARSALVYIPDDSIGPANKVSDEKYRSVKLTSIVALLPVCPGISRYVNLGVPSFVEDYARKLPLTPDQSFEDMLDKLAYAYHFSDVDIDFSVRDPKNPDRGMITTTVTLQYPLYFPIIDRIIADGRLLDQGTLPFYVNISSTAIFQNSEGFLMQYEP